MSSNTGRGLSRADISKVVSSLRKLWPQAAFTQEQFSAMIAMVRPYPLKVVEAVLSEVWSSQPASEWWPDRKRIGELLRVRAERARTLAAGQIPAITHRERCPFAERAQAIVERMSAPEIEAYIARLVREGRVTDEERRAFRLGAAAKRLTVRWHEMNRLRANAAQNPALEAA